MSQGFHKTGSGPIAREGVHMPSRELMANRRLVCLSPEGAAQLSPGRKPWVLTIQNRTSPNGATHCFAPLGLGTMFWSQTQGLRPGLNCAAPSGLRPAGRHFAIDSEGK